MKDEQTRKRAEEITRMSNEEFIRDQDLRKRDRKRHFDAATRKWFGSTFDDEFKSVDDVLTGLHAKEPGIRKLALFAVRGPWRHSVGSKPLLRIEEMALTDPDGNVRSAALIVLGSLFSGSCDTRIGALLSAVIRSDVEELGCRQSAYSGLLNIAGRKPELKLPAFPEAVDWSLVDSYLWRTPGKSDYRFGGEKGNQ